MGVNKSANTYERLTKFLPSHRRASTPLALPPDQEQRLLNRRRKADQTDPFASDPDDEVRRLGRLALRRDVTHPYDYLALGDLCARLSLVERTGGCWCFTSARRSTPTAAPRNSPTPDSPDRALAQAAIEAYVAG